MTSEGFALPAPCYTWGYPVYHPVYGYLMAVVIGMEFTDVQLRNFAFDHKFFFSGQDVYDFGYSINAGAKNYAIEIYYGGYPFPLGDYCLKIYWGEFGYGASVFSVVSEGGNNKFVGITKAGGINSITSWCSVNLVE